MKKLTFNKKLLIFFTIVISIVFSTLFLVFYSYYSKISLNNEYVELNHSSERISTQIDELFHQMSMAGLYISKNSFIHELLNSMYLNEDITEHEMISYSAKVRDQLNILTYYFPNTTNVTLFNSKNQFYFHSGLTDNNEKVSERLEDVKWYSDLIPKKNNLRILPPHQDFWVKIDRVVISIIRQIESNSKHDYGLLEFDIPYWNLENICKSNVTNEIQVLIFNDQNSLIYPYSNTIEYNHVQEIYNSEITFKTLHNLNKAGTININGISYLYSKEYSEFTNWTTVIVKYPVTFNSSKKIIGSFFILFYFIIMILIVIAFFLIIKKLTQPLNNLIANVKNIRIDDMKFQLQNDDIDEIKLLNDSFNIMFKNIKDSINQIYESKIREINANLLALQAQMNPHFIHNTLSVISASSEREGINETAIICNKLSNMLRYVSNSDSNFVCLSDEVNHTINYLDLIKTHYTDYNNPDKNYLSYEIDIPDEMYSLEVPRIIIQPLVENSINHGFNKTMPPWHISISGEYTSSTYWALTIIDNGSGFDIDILKKLHQQINEYNLNLKNGNFLQNSKIGGLGIMNTYTRLAIHYKNFNFILKNNSPNGAYLRLEVKNKEIV